ncbi:hypothetical protein GEMRC1_010059 [Eukaryota sp. GEM-RC1]
MNLDIDIDSLTQMTHYSVSSESISNAIRVLLPFQQRFPHPSMFYCQLFSNWLYEDGICTRTQSLQLSQNCTKAISTINFEVLSQMPPVELSWYLTKGYCDQMVIPEAMKCLSYNLGFQITVQCRKCNIA